MQRRILPALSFVPGSVVRRPLGLVFHIVIKMNTEGIQKLKTSGMKYTLIQVLRGNRAFNRL